MKRKTSISRFCRLNDISTNKLIKDLISKNKLQIDGDRLKILDFNLFYREFEGDNVLYVNEDRLDKFVENRLSNLQLHDSEKYTLRDINNSEILFNKVKKTKNKTLMYLDLEYRNGNYYELAYCIVKNNQVLTQEYFFTNDKKNTKKIDFLIKQEIPFRVLSRKDINLQIKKVVNSVDYIVAHNSYGERACLSRNAILLKKQKFICTADLTRKLNNFNQDISLNNSLKYYNIKFQNDLHHYAFYDVIMTKLLFEAILKS